MSQPPRNVPDYQGPMSAEKPPSPGLTPEQMRAMALGKQRAQKVLRAASVSTIDGTIMACFAVLALASFCLGWSGVILGVALAIVSFNSLRGAKRLRKFDPAAPTALAINQAFLAASIILYAIYSLHAGLSGSSEQLTQLGGLNDPEIKSLVGDMDSFYSLFYWAVYGGLIIGTVIAQGLTGLYYASRSKYLKAYLEDTPQWVVDLQRFHNG